MSSAALGDPDFPDEPEGFYFCSQEDDYDPQVTIISTYPSKHLPNRTLEAYVLMMLSTHILSAYANISYHRTLRGCLLDYCDEWTDVENCFRVGALCDDCEVEIQKRVRRNQVSIERVAAAIRLLNKAVGRKYCFVVMPFTEDLNPVYKVIHETLVEKGWKVKRADEISFPRLITGRIFQEILSSDLVVADLTGSNPNVFYEVGLTHAVGNDLLLVSQNEIPIDLKNEQTVFYRLEDLNSLKSALQHYVGSGG